MRPRDKRLLECLSDVGARMQGNKSQPEIKFKKKEPGNSRTRLLKRGNEGLLAKGSKRR